MWIFQYFFMNLSFLTIDFGNLNKYLIALWQIQLYVALEAVQWQERLSKKVCTKNHLSVIRITLPPLWLSLLNLTPTIKARCISPHLILSMVGYQQAIWVTMKCQLMEEGRFQPIRVSMISSRHAAAEVDATFSENVKLLCLTSVHWQYK